MLKAISCELSFTFVFRVEIATLTTKTESKHLFQMHDLLNFCLVFVYTFDIQNKKDRFKYINHNFRSLNANVHKFKRFCQWVLTDVFKSFLFVLHARGWMWKRMGLL